MPADPNDPRSVIEVTAAFPDSASRVLHKLPSEQQQAEFSNAVREATRTHLRAMRKLNGDTYNVGWYTSHNAGRRLAADDIRVLYLRQQERPQAFGLVVDIDDASISVRAFAISQSSMEYLERTQYFERLDPTQIDEEMLFKNLIVPIPVTFQLTPLEQMVLDQMLESFNLIADVFRLRNMVTMKKDLDNLTDTMDELNEHLGKAAEDKGALNANRLKRAEWLRERQETNEKRRLRQLPELPLEDLDTEVPLHRPISKHPIIYHTYQYNAKSTALAVAVEEEKTKITALTALGDAKS
jgi:hypothetical protein